MEIISRLQSTQNNEMSRKELEQLLDEELARPEANIDTELVDSLLNLLEGEAPEPALLNRQCRRSWRQIEQRLHKPAWPAVVAWAARGVAAIALIIALFFVTYQTAEALNWRGLLRRMQPLPRYSPCILIRSRRESWCSPH